MPHTPGRTAYDVVVVGGGAAGVAAAVSAARSGAAVCLVEQYGFLGGAATNSSVLAYCGFYDQQGEQVVYGFGDEFLQELHRHDLYRRETFSNSGNTVVLLDLETTKLILDKLVASAGIDVLFHSTLHSARRGPGGIESVLISHRGGNLELTAKAFVDCSGDGALLAAAGADHHLSPTDQRQASTLVMRVGGVAEDAETSSQAMDDALARYAARTGVELGRSNGTCVRLPLSRELMLLLADEHIDILDVQQLSGAESRARALCHDYLDAFVSFLPGWRDAYLAATGPQLGIREGRRLLGQETVRASDVSGARRRPEDAIARCGWPMEDHAVAGSTSYHRIAGKSWYHIPYGALASSDVTNLWAAGRLVSSDNRAFASLRVMGTSFATGQAAGLAAALYVRDSTVDVLRLQEALVGQGALL
ncbi:MULTISPECIES: FAD-dependent oxidoreductase [Arthrobacter]|uniref:FAD-dependent oxidoreductase n=1 Tax=Arthrobacter TaxID=1663 RepID=UPI00082C5702|nr:MULTISPECIES: FAD-dependent oxidoreductase [Arthrobacter]UPO76600.1 FAD-dependent oxidoreductase [Arthrobacter sp. Helios]